MQRLDALITELRKTGIAHSIIVDGSFVTDIDEPNDIDLIVVLNPAFEAGRQFRPIEYGLVSRRRVARRFGFDLYAAAEGTSEYTQALELFQMVRNMPGRQKGLVRIEL